LKFKNPARHFLVRVRLLIRNVETPGPRRGPISLAVGETHGNGNPIIVPSLKGPNFRKVNPVGVGGFASQVLIPAMGDTDV
jgi:hypothetical protein